MTPVAIALGSNLGDRERFLRRALDALRAIVADLRVSTFHDTAPVGTPDPQASYLNAAAVGTTALDPDTLLARLLDIERRHGRERPYVNAPRTLDLDLIFYGDAVIERPHLQVPHPRFRDRAFVLEPLAEIASGWVDPVTTLTVGELRGKLR